jgi:ubiquinone/menaquinone biosynthesis C-methylase UbiE
MHDHEQRDDHRPISLHRAHRLNDERRLVDQVSEHDLARLLALRGDEDVADLGSGTGFYTDRIAALTTGTVYAVDLQPEMNDAYRERGVPGNVRLVLGDITGLSLEPESVDVACTIATWHETGGKVDLPGLVRILRPRGRLVVIDWRQDPESWESGPPADLRFSKEEVAQSLAPFFAAIEAENLGRFMFAVIGARGPSGAGSKTRAPGAAG